MSSVKPIADIFEGSPISLFRWLTQPHIALGGRTPISVWQNGDETRVVELANFDVSFLKKMDAWKAACDAGMSKEALAEREVMVDAVMRLLQ